MKVMIEAMGAAVAFIVAIAVVISGPSGGEMPSAVATDEIPADLLPVYVDAAAGCEGLPWQVLAAIGFIESRHAEGNADPFTGDVQPLILGPALDGSNGTMRLPDAAAPDGWTHAQGPMQFLPTTWERWGELAPLRPAGTPPSPDNAWDAIYTAADYLCGGRGAIDDLEAAIFSYNHSDDYLRAVLDKAIAYGLG